MNKTITTIIVVLAVIAAAALYIISEKPNDNSATDFNNKQIESTADESLSENNQVSQEDSSGDTDIDQDVSVNSDVTTNSELNIKGTVLADGIAKVYDFNQEDYQQTLTSDKLIVLYYYANWCPICREEIPKFYEAFEYLERDDVIGFRVNYNDSDTDSAEQDLAREHGVAYQHTKVFVKGGERILKSPETWGTQRYLDEINNALK